MNGSGDNEVEGLDDINNQSPAKNKSRKSGFATTKPDTLLKHKVKSALKTKFLDNNHVHNAPRILAEASMQLKGDAPLQEFIVNL
jgi:hypothetical protein